MQSLTQTSSCLRIFGKRHYQSADSQGRLNSRELELLQLGLSAKEVQSLVLQNFNENDLRESEQLHQDDLVLAQAMSTFFGRQTLKDASEFKSFKYDTSSKNYLELKERGTRLLKELGTLNYSRGTWKNSSKRTYRISTRRKIAHSSQAACQRTSSQTPSLR